MSKLFCFLPSCHITITEKEILVYDAFTFNKVYLKDVTFSISERQMLRDRGCLLYTSQNEDFIRSCVQKQLGYYIDYDGALPFFPKKGLSFLSSLQKEKKALGYNLASYTNLMLKSLTVLANNSRNAGLDASSYRQLEYPEQNDDFSDIDLLLRTIEPFIFLEEIIISGELQETQLIQVLESVEKKGILVTYRIFYDVCLLDSIRKLLDAYEHLFVELIIDSNASIEFDRLKNNRLYYKRIVCDLSDLQSTPPISNLRHHPLFNKHTDHSELVSQMVVTPDEILNGRKSLRDCQIADYVNSEQFGHLVLDSKGNVLCLNQYVGSIQGSSLAAILNKWLDHNTCIWYYTRRQKESCKECALQALCPPISIYEQMGFITCPCKG
jgi:hypothetical protein